MHASVSFPAVSRRTTRDACRNACVHASPNGHHVGPSSSPTASPPPAVQLERLPRRRARPRRGLGADDPPLLVQSVEPVGTAGRVRPCAQSSCPSAWPLPSLSTIAPLKRPLAAPAPCRPGSGAWSGSGSVSSTVRSSKRHGVRGDRPGRARSRRGSPGTSGLADRACLRNERMRRTRCDRGPAPSATPKKPRPQSTCEQTRHLRVLRHSGKWVT
jgi:hypothetical protein